MQKLIAVVLAIITAATAIAEPRHRQRSENKNYILRRQQAYQVEGVPTSRLIIGRREIDVYRAPGGGKIMFEKDNVVGVRP